MPSISEAFGLSLLEAMSCGCPAIASAVGGVHEIMNDSNLGWLIPKEDENALLAAMRSAVEIDIEKLQQMGINAREHAIRNFKASDRWNEVARLH